MVCRRPGILWVRIMKKDVLIYLSSASVVPSCDSINHCHRRQHQCTLVTYAPDHTHAYVTNVYWWQLVTVHVVTYARLCSEDLKCPNTPIVMMQLPLVTAHTERWSSLSKVKWWSWNLIPGDLTFNPKILITPLFGLYTSQFSWLEK
jgi:hypothetical protein